ncbi:helix-turn-helix domain-containing protein [Paraburkholderia largidicola]|uniref:helix-turn-helix domain-containing protein n=1 Tax=Paraburkholderia largidicola TaxID=3014751 RepID=UPI0015DA79BA|nr:helix-turn-helix transcriptional regulator [Paraburkholderia sp. PGU16]
MRKFEERGDAVMEQACKSALHALPGIPGQFLSNTASISVEPGVERHVHTMESAVDDTFALACANQDGLRLLIGSLSFRLLASILEQGPPPYEMSLQGWLSIDQGLAHPLTQAVDVHLRFGDNAPHTRSSPNAEGVGIQKRIHESATFLRSNLEQIITVANVARIASMSERNFLRHFRQQFRVTPSEYLLQARLEKSCQLLIESELPVDKIARRCGMTSGTRLAKIFRKRYGMSPTEFRLQNG